MLTGDRPGCTPDDPMAFLVSKFVGQMRVATYTRGNTLERMVREVTMLTCFPAFWNYDPNWLTYKAGEILDITHEEPLHQPYIYDGGEFKRSDSMN